MKNYFEYNEFMEAVWSGNRVEDPHVAFSSTGDALVIRMSCWDRSASARRSVERHTLWLDLVATRVSMATTLAELMIKELTKPLARSVQWTKEPPEELGQYWASNGQHVWAVTVFKDEDGGLVVVTPGDDEPMPLADVLWWSTESIPKPEAPDA